MDKARDLIQEWRDEADDTVMSASRVQDRLFDLYGEVREGPAASVVEHWLLLTRQRQMFTRAELDEFLDEVTGRLSSYEASPVG